MLDKNVSLCIFLPRNNHSVVSIFYRKITILWYGGRIKKAGGMASEGNDKMSGLQTRKSNFWNERISDLGKRPG